MYERRMIMIQTEIQPRRYNQEIINKMRNKDVKWINYFNQKAVSLLLCKLFLSAQDGVISTNQSPTYVIFVCYKWNFSFLRGLRIILTNLNCCRSNFKWR